MKKGQLIEHLNSATMYLDQGNPLAAEQGFNIVLSQDPDNKDALIGMAQIAHAQGHIDEAKKVAATLLRLYSDDPSVLIIVGSLMGDTSLMGRAYTLNPFDASIGLGYAKALISEFESIKASEVLRGINCGENLELKLVVAELLVECSEIKVSCSYLEDIISARPDSWLAYCHALPLFDHAASSVCTETKVREVLSRLSTPKDKLPMLYNGLGRLLEQRGDVEGSWGAYNTANDTVKKSRVNYPNYKDIATKYKEVFTKDFFKEMPPTEGESPLVFVFGMPRSGTTLVEQILGSHSDITALGELMSVSESAHDFSKLWAQHSSDVPSCPEDLAETYLSDRVRHFDTKFAVDKMPANYKFIPLIYAMFPTAKFIYCKRDAVDNCFSCLTTLFAHRHDYSFDQTELGKEYNHHLWLMDLWGSILPKGTIHQVNYEDMVTNQRETTQGILNYIGVPFEEGCTSFYNLKRNVRTASLAQVVKPLYSSSVNRATPYKKYLSELLEVLHGNH